jgi:hypothetical protein
VFPGETHPIGVVVADGVPIRVFAGVFVYEQPFVHAQGASERH